MPVRTAQQFPEHIDDNGFPLAGSLWLHHSGVIYCVLMMTNVEPERQDEFPTTVVYQSGKSGKRYSLALDKWWQKRIRPTQ